MMEIVKGILGVTVLVVLFPLWGPMFILRVSWDIAGIMDSALGEWLK